MSETLGETINRLTKSEIPFKVQPGMISIMTENGLVTHVVPCQGFVEDYLAAQRQLALAGETNKRLRSAIKKIGSVNVANMSIREIVEQEKMP